MNNRFARRKCVKCAHRASRPTSTDARTMTHIAQGCLQPRRPPNFEACEVPALSTPAPTTIPCLPPPGESGSSAWRAAGACSMEPRPRRHGVQPMPVLAGRSGSGNTSRSRGRKAVAGWAPRPSASLLAWPELNIQAAKRKVENQRSLIWRETGRAYWMMSALPLGSRRAPTRGLENHQERDRRRPRARYKAEFRVGRCFVTSPRRLTRFSRRDE